MLAVEGAILPAPKSISAPESISKVGPLQPAVMIVVGAGWEAFDQGFSLLAFLQLAAHGPFRGRIAAGWLRSWPGPLPWTCCPAKEGIRCRIYWQGRAVGSRLNVSQV